MWNSKRDMIDPKELIIRLFGPEGTKVQNQCVRSYWLKAFLAAFPAFYIFYTSFMPKINVIDYKTEGKTEAYAFAPLIFSESSLFGNQSVFEDFNIIQIGIDKRHLQWDDWLTIWWGNQKTEAQMLRMQENNIRIHWPYDWYWHIFLELTLWHLRFNYLKMIWELFYPGDSVTKWFILQKATDHWHWDKTTRPTDFHFFKDPTIHSYWARVIVISKV